MCAPSTVGEALAAVRAGLAFLNQVPAADLPGVVQADCLRELARAGSAYTAAHARMLGAFSVSGAHEDDGQQSGRAWLRWQTQITRGAAAGAVGWMKRLAAHPAVSTALADGAVSPSWARHICTWTGALPEDQRDDADAILLAAVAGVRCCRIWLGWRGRCAVAPRPPTRMARTAMRGLRSGGCGWA